MSEEYLVDNVLVIDGGSVRCCLRMQKTIALVAVQEMEILGVPITLDSGEVVLRGRVELVVRLFGVDVPELRSGNPLEKEAAQIVAAEVEGWFAGWREKKADVAARFFRRDKRAGSIDADFVPQVRGFASLADWLVRHGLAKRRDGGARQEWTESELLEIKRKGGRLLLLQKGARLLLLQKGAEK